VLATSYERGDMDIKPIDQVLWYLKPEAVHLLRSDITVDVVIVGGGMAGLSAAQAFHRKGLRVALVEKYYCGAGASGKSSGFITPDSEFSLADMIERYGLERARALWEFGTSGVEHIRKNIESFSLDCDYKVEDTCVIANSSKTFAADIAEEHKARKKLGYPSTLYRKEEVPSTLGSTGYYGAMRYSGSFGINGYAYCQQMKHVLQEQGVAIYEETPAVNILDHSVETPYGHIKAEHSVVCVDLALPELGLLQKEIYHVQTFLLLSAPLKEREIQSIFPDGTLMAWDTDLIYNYFRIAGDNRLMVGGGSLLSSYALQEQHHNWRVARKLENYFKRKFPQVKLTFEYFWPGLIGVTKDIIPLAGKDLRYRSIYCISGAAGLPWAAALGLYSADHLIDKRTDFDDYFSPQRPFPIGGIAQTFLGTPLTFALSHLKTLNSY
jgi:gamma-glutamylputrescine oxidase